MASTNLDLVRSVFAAWEHGDYRRVEWVHPEIEFTIADGPSPGSWTGLASMAEGFREEVLGAFQDTRAEADEYRELDDERAVVLFRRGGRGKTSGLELGQIRSKGAVLFHARGGEVTRLVFYWDRDRALADLGLVP